MRWEVKERKDFFLAKKRYLYNSSLLAPTTPSGFFGIFLPRYGAVSARGRTPIVGTAVPPGPVTKSTRGACPDSIDG